MSYHTKLGAWLAKDQPGRSLPQELYISEEAFEFDTQVMLKSVWLFACTSAHVKNAGDYHLFEMANASVIILRGKDGEVRAYHNSCAHRGAKICTSASGSSPRLTCPYHQWTYGLDGKLLAARHMPDGFEKGENGLKPVAIENIGGLLFVCLGDTPPPIDRVKSDIEDQISIYQIERLKVAAQEDMIHNANWKLVMENNRECYHCESNHPELLNSLTSYGFGKDLPEDEAPPPHSQSQSYEERIEPRKERWTRLGIYRDLVEFPDDWWHRIARLPLAHSAVSQTLDGKPASTMPIWTVPETSSSSLSIWTQPNSWHHFCCDHAVSFSVKPLGPSKTLVRTSWLVHEDAEEGVHYDVQNLKAVWMATNRQDGALSELNHAGIATDGYSQGFYSTEEKLVEKFKNFYVSRAKIALEKVKP